MKYIFFASYTQAISEAYGPDYSLCRTGTQYITQITIYKISVAITFTNWKTLK